MSLTGILGTSDSRPGSMVLGSASRGELGFIAKAVIYREQSASFSMDAAIALRIESTFVADAITKRTITASLTADAVVFKTATSSFSASAEISQNLPILADAWIYFDLHTGSFSADAFIHLIVWNDDFNRADGPLGAPYVIADGSASIESNEVVVPTDSVGDIRHFPMAVGPSTVSFDLLTSPEPSESYTYIDLTQLSFRQESDNLWRGVWVDITAVGVAVDATHSTWNLFANNADSGDIVLEINTWYTIKAGYADQFEGLKIWKRGDPEPGWMWVVTTPTTYVAEPSFTPTWWTYSNISSPLHLDNLLITGLTAGVDRVFGSFTANAILKRTIEFAGGGSEYPSVIGAQSGVAFSGSAQVSTPAGTRVGDTIIAFSGYGGQITESSMGTVRGTLGGPTLRSIFHNSTVSGLGGSIKIWSGVVSAAFGGGVPDTWVLENTVGSGARVFGVMTLRNGRPEVVRVSGYFNNTTTDKQTIPAGTHEFARNFSVAIPVFTATQSGTSSFLPPSNTGEYIDVISGSPSASHVVMEVALGLVSAGASPVFEADVQGGTSVTQSAIVEVSPVAGLTADAVLYGTIGSLTLDAFIEKPAHLVFEDTFDDRIVAGGWGGQWQTLSGGASYASVDGVMARVTDNSPTRSQFLKYPSISDGYYEFEFRFGARNNWDHIDLEAVGPTGYSVFAEITSTGFVYANSTSTTMVIALNQWYVSRLTIYGDYAEHRVWRRGETMPASPTVTGSSSFIPTNRPEISIGATAGDGTTIDAFRVYTGSGWRVFGVVTADAVRKKTMLTHLDDFNIERSNQISLDALLLLGGRLTLDAFILTARVSASVSANAVFVTYHQFHGDAEITAFTRTTHDRGGHDHTGVDYETVHTLAASIGAYAQGTNLRDVLIAINERLTQLEAR